MFYIIRIFFFIVIAKMDNWFYILDSSVAMLLSCILAGVLIPRILLISFRKKLFDEVDSERKIHCGAIPRLGGIAFGPVILFSIFFIAGFNISVFPGESFRDMAFGEIVILSGILCASLLVYLVGIADDLVRVNFYAKFVVQIIAACLLVASGLWISNLHGLFGINELPKFIGYPLTIVFVVFVVNSINLIDGIDGLASCLSMVALFVYGISFVVYGNILFSLICFTSVGVLIPFFYFNVFGDPSKKKKIFMGDTGSLTIGLIISAVILRIIIDSEMEEEGIGNLIVKALSPVIVPCFDVVRVIFVRIKEKKKLFLPDNNHIHHRLLQAGLTQHAALITIVTVSLILTSINIIASNFINVNILLAFDVIIYCFLSIAISNQIFILRKN